MRGRRRRGLSKRPAPSEVAKEKSKRPRTNSWKDSMSASLSQQSKLAVRGTVTQRPYYQSIPARKSPPLQGPPTTFNRNAPNRSSSIAPKQPTTVDAKTSVMSRPNAAPNEPKPQVISDSKTHVTSGPKPQVVSSSNTSVTNRYSPPGSASTSTANRSNLPATVSGLKPGANGGLNSDPSTSSVLKYGHIQTNTSNIVSKPTSAQTRSSTPFCGNTVSNLKLVQPPNSMTPNQQASNPVTVPNFLGTKPQPTTAKSQSNIGPKKYQHVSNVRQGNGTNQKFSSNTNSQLRTIRKPQHSTGQHSQSTSAPMQKQTSDQQSVSGQQKPQSVSGQQKTQSGSGQQKSLSASGLPVVSSTHKKPYQTSGSLPAPNHRVHAPPPTGLGSSFSEKTALKSVPASSVSSSGQNLTTPVGSGGEQSFYGRPAGASAPRRTQTSMSRLSSCPPSSGRSHTGGTGNASAYSGKTENTTISSGTSGVTSGSFTNIPMKSGSNSVYCGKAGSSGSTYPGKAGSSGSVYPGKSGSSGPVYSGKSGSGGSTYSGKAGSSGLTYSGKAGSSSMYSGRSSAYAGGGGDGTWVPPLSQKHLGPSNAAAGVHQTIQTFNNNLAKPSPTHVFPPYPRSSPPGQQALFQPQVTPGSKENQFPGKFAPNRRVSPVSSPDDRTGAANSRNSEISSNSFPSNNLSTSTFNVVSNPSNLVSNSVSNVVPNPSNTVSNYASNVVSNPSNTVSTSASNVVSNSSTSNQNPV
eukprot:218844_1